MATASRYHAEMPSLFTPERLDAHSKSKTNIFAPVPRFPITTETTGRRVINLGAHETHKRFRHEEDHSSNTTTSQTGFASPWAENSLVFSRFSNAKSPPPLANDRYELAAGGMERTDMFARHNGEYDDYFGLQKQREMWTPGVKSASSRLPDYLASDVAQSTPNGSKPWMLNQILSLVGGVAGKLVSFCAVPFRGFQAGGGQAYMFTPQGEVARTDPRDDPFTNLASRAGPIQGTLPGEYPEDDYGVRSIDSIENERPRMSKRLRTGESWVMVDQDGGMISRPSTPRLSERRVPNHARSPSQIPRPASRAGTPTSTPKRPSLIPVSRRSTMDRHGMQEASKMPVKPYSTPRSYSRQSYGSPAMFRDTSNVKTSPLPPESQRLINKIRREDMEDEARIRRMSSQMSDMLRQAKEALGSKYEIEDECTGGGGMTVDDEGYSEEQSWYRR